MTISREKCLEMADRLAKECTSGDEFLEALINHAYAEGQKDMQKKLAGDRDYGYIDWRGCNEI